MKLRRDFIKLPLAAALAAALAGRGKPARSIMVGSSDQLHTRKRPFPSA